jgi:flagellar hook-length control protein FliK
VEKLVEKLKTSVTHFNHSAAQAELTPATAAFAGGRSFDLALQPLGGASVLTRSLAGAILPGLVAVQATVAPALQAAEAAHLDAIELLSRAAGAVDDKNKELVQRERELGAVTASLLQVSMDLLVCLLQCRRCCCWGLKRTCVNAG